MSQHFHRVVDSAGILSTRRIKTLTVFLCLVCGVWSASASAGLLSMPCESEAKKFCQEVEPGRGNILTCIKEHNDDLSWSCRQFLKKFQKSISAMTDVCQEETWLYCRDQKPEYRPIKDCMKRHLGDLTEECRKAVEKL